jgi:hypothetical protein
LFFLALNFAPIIQAQKEIEQKKRADNFFQNQQYSQAISDYRQLLAQNQKNMEINFKYATCLFYTEDIKESKRYFDLVLAQAEVPTDAYFYRAKIYQHQYNFNKAIELFTKYLELKPKKEQNLDAQTEINFCKQAKSAIGQPSSLKILARTTSPGIEFQKHYTTIFSTKKYEFYSIDDVFEKQNTKQNFKPSYAFLRGMRYRIFASYNDNSESGKDLFIQKKDEKGEWGKPIRLCPEINSSFDEDFPFFDEIDGYLYFSSRGHGSIGGYDLFKVKYSLEANTCSELENLGFPYSSPNDDYLFVPDYGTPNALFATNRNGNPSKIEIVKVEKQQKKVEMLFVKGAFSDLIDPQNTDLELTVKHKKTGEVFGPIYTSKEGKYVVCLPKDGIYSFQVKVTGSLTVFNKEVEITIPPKGKQFSQEINYEMINSKEELTIISKVTNEVADDEMDLLMFTQIGKLEVNAQTLQQDGISSKTNDQGNNPEVGSESKENPLIEQLLDKEIDLENQLQNQIVVQQLIEQNEAQIEAQQQALDALRLQQNQTNNLDERKQNLETIKSKEVTLNQLINETIVLKELELSEREVVERRGDLAKLTELNKNLAEQQLKGEKQQVEELISSNQAFVNSISEKQFPSVEERIGMKSALITSNKTTSENEIKQYQQQETNLSKEIEALRVSKEGKSKKQIEEIDLAIAQKEKNLKTIRQVKENAFFMLEELTLKELALNGKSDLTSEIETKSAQIKAEELQKSSPIYVEKFNISTMADLVKENKRLTREETRKVEDLQKAASTSAQITDSELAKIQEKYNSGISQIDTNLPAAEIIDFKISNEQNLSANLSELLKKVTNEEQKEKLNELIQLSNSRLESLKQERDALNISSKTEEKPETSTSEVTTIETKPEKTEITSNTEIKPETLSSEVKTIETKPEKTEITSNTEIKPETSSSEVTTIETKPEKTEITSNTEIKPETSSSEVTTIETKPEKTEITSKTEIKPETSTTETLPIDLENQQQIEVFNSLQTQNEARSKVLNQALNLKKEELLKTIDAKEIARLDKEIRSLEAQIQSQNSQAFLNEKNSVIKKEFPSFQLINESERKAKIAALSLEKEQAKQLLKTTISPKDKNVIEQQIIGIESSIEVLEKVVLTSKTEEEVVVLPESEVLDNEQLTKKSARNNYVTYIEKRNVITQLDNEIGALKTETNTLRKTLNQEINKDSQVEISNKQRELLTIISQNEKVIEEKQTLRNQTAKALGQTSDASDFEWMVKNNIQVTVAEKLSSNSAIAVSNPVETAFKIIDKQSVDVSAPLPVNIKNPRGLLYRVQVGAFRKPVPNEFFREFSPVSGDVLPNGLTCYMAGYFNNVNTVSTAKNDIRSIGYKDAFIVAYCDGKRISFAEAKALEASGACVPLTDNELKIAVMESLPTPIVYETAVLPNPVTPIIQKPVVDLTYNQAEGAVEAIPVESLEALFFTVQVGVYNRPVKQEQLPGFTELFTSKSAKGQIRYSSGKFQSVEAAKLRRKEAVDKGVADAFIVAYYKGARITIAEANNLVNRLGQSVFDESQKTETNAIDQNNSMVQSGKEIVILEKKEIKEKIIKFEQPVDEEKVIALLEQLNQKGIFTYNSQTGKVSSFQLKEGELTVELLNTVVDMNEVNVTIGKVKPITFVLKSTNWSGSFGNWILHCPYEFKPLSTKEIKFFPRSEEESEEIKQIAKELLISIYE